MAISVTNIGTVNATSGANTISATVTSGAMIFVGWHDTGTGGSNASVADAVSNTYSLITSLALNNSNGNGKSGMHYVQSATALSAQNITCTPTTGNTAAFTLFYATGLTSTPLDTTVTQTAFGNSGTPSVTAAAVPAVASSLIVGLVAWTAAGFTQDSTNAAYAAPPTNSNLASATHRNVAGGNVVSSSQLTYAPTFTSSTWSAFIVAFKPSSVSPNVNLTGIASTASVGSLTPEVDKTLTGQAATGSVGSFTPEVDKTLTGVSATASVGSFTPEVDKTLTGQSATGSVGSFTPEVDKTLTGQSATGSVGSFSIEIDKALTGVSATASIGSLSVSISKSVTLSGVSATGSVGGVSVVTLTPLGTLAPGLLDPYTLTGVTVPAGATIIIGWYDGGGLTTTVTDDAGNSYSTLTTVPADNLSVDGIIGLTYTVNALAISPSNTITLTGHTQPGCCATLGYVTGVNVVDSTVTATAFGASATPSVTGAHAPANTNSLIVGIVGCLNSPTFTQDSTHAAWSSVPLAKAQFASQCLVAGGTAFSSSALTYAPTFGSSQPWGAIITAFAEVGSASVTGVSATGSVGSLSVSLSQNVTLSGVSATGSIGSFSIEIDESPALTGVAATSAIGALSISDSSSVTLTGVSATGQIGTLSVQHDANVTLTGVSATSAVGSVSEEVDQTLNGVAASGAIGTLTPSDSVTLSGVSSTSAIGAPTIGSDSSFTLTGVASTAAVGALTPSIQHSITGQAATSAIGTFITSQTVLPGQHATGQIGTLFVHTQNLVIVGQQALGFVGSFLVIVQPNFTNITIPNGVSATAAVG